MKQTVTADHANAEQQLTALAAEVVRVLDQQCKAGCKERTWKGFENGHGIEVGTDIERLIYRAKRVLKKAT